jgi:hypothetical protein
MQCGCTHWKCKDDDDDDDTSEQCILTMKLPQVFLGVAAQEIALTMKHVHPCKPTQQVTPPLARIMLVTVCKTSPVAEKIIGQLFSSVVGPAVQFVIHPSIRLVAGAPRIIRKVVHARSNQIHNLATTQTKLR